MEHPGDSPDSHATRRRVWRFVFGSLFVAAVVAFWPLKEYNIDEDRFLTSLGPSYFVYYFANDSPTRGHAMIGCHVVPYATHHCSQESFEEHVGSLVTRAPEWESAEATWNQIPGLDSRAFAYQTNHQDEARTDFIEFVCHHRNVLIQGFVESDQVPPGQTSEQMVHEALEALRDGIDREVPGVTTFYSPPVRQLWIGRVRPFLSERFPGIVPLRSEILPNPSISSIP